MFDSAAAATSSFPANSFRVGVAGQSGFSLTGMAGWLALEPPRMGKGLLRATFCLDFGLGESRLA